jgi:hypothetical protein
MPHDLIPPVPAVRAEGIGDYEYWCEATLELMRRCDVVYAMQGWENSKGARGEVAEANKLGIPVIYHDLAGKRTMC